MSLSPAFTLYGLWRGQKGSFTVRHRHIITDSIPCEAQAQPADPRGLLRLPAADSPEEEGTCPRAHRILVTELRIHLLPWTRHWNTGNMLGMLGWME